MPSSSDLNGLEVVVDDQVEQPVEQERDSVAGQIGARIPAVDERVDVEPVVVLHRHERGFRDERRHLGGLQLAAVDVERDVVGVQKEVVGIAVELGPLVGGDGVLDREGVQVQLLGDDVQLALHRGADVEPDQLAGVEMIADVLRPESLRRSPSRRARLGCAAGRVPIRLAAQASPDRPRWHTHAGGAGREILGHGYSG